MPLSKPQLLFGLVIGTGIFLGLLQVVDYPWAIDQLFVTFLLTIWLFQGAVHAKQLLEAGELGDFLTWCWSPGLFVVLWLDFTFNAVWGSYIFRERPQWEDREVLFTSRMQRWVDAYMVERDNAGRGLTYLPSDDLARRRVKAAFTWGLRVNRIDPNHIKRLPTNVHTLLAML